MSYTWEGNEGTYFDYDPPDSPSPHAGLVTIGVESAEDEDGLATVTVPIADVVDFVDYLRRTGQVPYAPAVI